MVTRSYKIGADKFVTDDPHLKFLVDDSGLAKMARNHTFILVQPLPFLGAHEADFLALGIHLQHPGHAKPRRWSRNRTGVAHPLIGYLEIL